MLIAPGGEVEFTGHVVGTDVLLAVEVLVITICLSGGVVDV